MQPQPRGQQALAFSLRPLAFELLIVHKLLTEPAFGADLRSRPPPAVDALAPKTYFGLKSTTNVLVFAAEPINRAGDSVGEANLRFPS